MDEYDIREAFAAMEEELVKSMMRNLKRHRIEEITENKEWIMWRSEQLKALDRYRKSNEKMYNKQFSLINNSVDRLINQSRAQGYSDQEKEILEAIKNGFKPMRSQSINNRTSAEFFWLNDRKLKALIKATHDNFKKSEVAMLRRANDQYRKIIYSAQVYANSGATTYEKAVDMATKDFLIAGINCIEYKNGTRVNISSYVAMALQTASKRAYLTGEGEKRQEWGISTVIMNKRGAACLKCLPFVGKIFIDDVWSGGKASDGNYPLLSSAIAKGLYHPNCKDSHTTYFDGITTPPKHMTQADVDQAAENYRVEQQKKYNKRMEQKYKSLKEGNLDDENRKKYELLEKEWKSPLKEVENSQKGVNRETVIDRPIINSSPYRKKFDALGESNEITRSLHAEAKKMLYHRSGTVFEDLAFVNFKTGEVLKSVDYEKVREAKPTKQMFKMLDKSNKGEIIAIHNHPNSTPPSLSDLIVAQQRGYKYGIIACHDGKIYKYKIHNDINQIYYNSAVARFNRDDYTENSIKQFCASVRDAGVEMEVF